MENKKIIAMGETLGDMMAGCEKNKNGSITSLSDCIMGMAVMKAAVEEVSLCFVKNFQIINQMAKEGLIVRGTHFDTAVDYDGDYILRLNYSHFFNKFKEYAKENCSKDFYIDNVKDFKVLLKANPICKEYNRPAWFNVMGESYSNKKLFRVAILYVHKMQQCGMSIDALIDR